jgi:hypothetical protein
MLRRVALVRTDVLEGLSASIIRVTKIGALGTTLAVISNGRTRALTRATRRNIPEDDILQYECESEYKSLTCPGNGISHCLQRGATEKKEFEHLINILCMIE